MREPGAISLRHRAGHRIARGNSCIEAFLNASAKTLKTGSIQHACVGSILEKTIEHEPVSKTGIKHVAGTVSMAAFSPGTAKADFFILTADAPSFDANFAAFGRVVEGMDVAKAIQAAPTSPTKGEGIMKGQMLDPVVKITKASRIKQ